MDKAPKIINIQIAGRNDPHRYIDMVQVDGINRFVVYHKPDWEFPTEQASSWLKDSIEAKLTGEKLDPREYGAVRVPAYIETIKKFSGEMDDRYENWYVPIKRCPWVPPSEPVEDTPENIFRFVRKYVVDHCDFADPRTYDLIALWIMATWVPEIFEVVPYLMLLGPPASGKTRVLEVCHALGYRCVLGSTISEPALYQCVENWKATLLLDETERYNGEKNATVQNILNSGYRRGQYAIRAKIDEGGHRSLEMFEVFGFKGLAGTQSMLATLESRSLLINMVKATRKLRFTLDKPRALLIKNRLLRWRWTMLDNLEEHQHFFENIVPEVFSFTNGRFIEIFASLYTIHPPARPVILEYAHDIIGSYDAEEQTSREAMITVAICEARSELKNGMVPYRVVQDLYNEELAPSEALNARTIGVLLKKLGFKKARTEKTRGIVWNEGLLKRLVIRYVIDEKVYGKTLVSAQRSLSSSESFGSGPEDIPDRNDPNDRNDREGETSHVEEIVEVPEEETPEVVETEESTEDDEPENLIKSATALIDRAVGGWLSEYDFYKRLRVQGFSTVDIQFASRELEKRGIVTRDSSRTLIRVKETD